MIAGPRFLGRRAAAAIWAPWVVVAALSCADQPEPFPPVVVARYDGGVVTLAEVSERFTREQGDRTASAESPSELTEKEQRPRIARRLVAERTWTDAMTPERLAAEPALQGRLDQARRDMLLSFMLSRGLGISQLVREEEARERYERANPRELRLLTTYTLRHLFVSVPDDSPPEVWAAAEAKAADARARLTAPKADLDQIIAATSDSEDAASGGWIRRLRLGTVEGLSGAFEDVVAKLEPGETSSPVRTRRGYQLVHLVSRTAARTVSFGEVREQIAGRILEERRDRRLEEIGREREAHDPLVFDVEAFRSGNPDAVVLRGKTTAMKLSELQLEEPRSTAVLAQTKDAASVEMMIRDLLRNRYLIDHARQQGLDRAPELEAQWQVRRQELLVDHEASRLLGKRLDNVPPEEVRRFFEENQARFASARRLHLRGLFLQYASKDLYATYALAAAMRERLEGGEALEKLVASHAVVQGPQGDGDFGWVTHEDLAARGRLFHDTVVKAPVGGWIGPVKWEQGYAVVRIEAVEEPKIPPFEEVESRVRRSFVRRRAGAMREALEDEVFRSRKGELNPALVPAGS